MNFYLTDKFITNQIDGYRSKIINEKINQKNNVKNNKFKILHVTNFNERHNGRLFYNTGRRINNGFVRLNHSVLTLSDRDVVSYYRSVRDLEIPDNIKVQMIEKLAETDFRLSEGANSRIQIEAVVANFTVLGRHIQKE